MKWRPTKYRDKCELCTRTKTLLRFGRAYEYVVVLIRNEPSRVIVERWLGLCGWCQMIDRDCTTEAKLAEWASTAAGMPEYADRRFLQIEPTVA